VTPATKRLGLLRHAKSSWSDPSLPDADRPLGPRGRRAVAAMAGHLAQAGIAPDLVLCSPARRAVETLDAVRGGLPADLDVRFEDGLYATTATGLLRILRLVPDDVGAVLVVGHNPGLEDLAQGLAGGGSPELLLRLTTKYPTGALATVRFRGAWADLGWGTATLETFVVPRDLC
jgi:phosphohistidine phosphatase